MKSEHAQTVSQLSAQHEALRGSFRDQVLQLQEEHRRTVETLQQQLSRLQAQLFQLRSEPSTRSMYVCSGRCRHCPALCVCASHRPEEVGDLRGGHQRQCCGQ